jgi:hypothetical protein
VALSLLDLVTKGHGRKLAEAISLAIAALLAIVGLALGQPFIAVFAVIVAVMNITALRGVQQQSFGAEVVAAQRLLVAHRPAEAEQVARQFQAQNPTGPASRAAAELLGWSRLWQGDQAGAEAAVNAASAAGPPSPVFRAAQALAAGRLVEGVSIMSWAFANDPGNTSLVLGAVAVAGTGQTRPMASELLRMDGSAGVQGALRLQQLLQFTGYQREAEAVGSMIAADGRAAPLPRAQPGPEPA